MRIRYAVPAAALLLAGCSAGTDVETLLRAPQLSGESAALQRALNSYLGASATLKYPSSGDFLSPFAFGDWDGDGTDEAAVLYTADSAGSNVSLAVLEPTGENSWQVSQTVEGLSSEVETFSAAHLRDATSRFWLGTAAPRATAIWWFMNMTARAFPPSAATATARWCWGTLPARAIPRTSSWPCPPIPNTAA